MSTLANDDLQRRVEELEAENLALRGSAAAVPSSPSGGRAPSDGPGEPRRKRTWGWTLLSTLLIVIGAVLAPFAVVTSWAKVALTDTDQFVATYAPLAKDAEVQTYVTQQTMAVINQQVNIPQITSDVIDGITALGTGPRATQALQLLKAPAADGLQNLIETGVTKFVESDAFANVWATALRVSHAQLIAALQDDPNAALTIGANGTIGIQLGPIVEGVKQSLLDQGIGLASRIPAVDRTIVLAQSDALPEIQLAYGAIVSAGAWLPWVALLFLAAGVLVSRHRARALIWSAIALALAMAVTLIALAVGNFALVNALSPDLLPARLTELLYGTVADDMRATAIAVLVLAVVVAVVGWLAGPFRVPRRLRGLGTEAAGRIRDVGDRRGITTGRTGEWIYQHRVLLRAGIAVIAGAVVLLVRPVTVELTLWTLFFAVLAIVILELLQRPVITIPAGAVPDTVPPLPMDGVPVAVSPLPMDGVPVAGNGDDAATAVTEVPVVKAD